jgi:glucose/arabinose dehydrogenase
LPDVKPDYALGPHTASLGLVFYNHTRFPASFRGGAFIGQHGSWNRRSPSGYKVVYVSFDAKGMPSADVPIDFLTGFTSDETYNTVHGRPVGLAVAKGDAPSLCDLCADTATASDGSLLVADDSAGIVWRVQYAA